MREQLVIWKFPILATGSEIELPRRHRVLCVQVQNGTPHIWVLVDPHSVDEKIKRRYEVYGTGHPVPYIKECPVYVGTFQLAEGSLVFHLWMDCQEEL